MTPQEKAKELVYKFAQITDDYHRPSKQCALICINEMLDFRNKLYMNEGSLLHEYLLEVKTEIERL